MEITKMKEILNKLHLSIKEFGELYEIPYQTVRQWAVGERKMPQYLKKLIEKDIEHRSKGEQLEIKSNNEKEELIKTLEYAKKIFNLRFHVYDDNKDLFIKCVSEAAAEIILYSKKSIKSIDK